jgi:DNA-binding response OmpR family regulator
MSQRVLVIEDDALLRDAVDLILTQAGYRVFTAGTGREGLIRVREVTPQVVLLDINMPGINGLETLGRLRKSGHRMPILMMTTDNRPDTVREVIALGGDGYVLKPFQPNELVARVRKALDDRLASGG